MPTQLFVVLLGIALIVVGFLGFLPAALTPPAQAEQLRVSASEGYLFGLFHVNAVNSIVYILVGALGLMMSAMWSTARTYCAIVAVVYGALAILGLIPPFQTLFGLMPLHGHSVWVHALVAVAAACFAFVPASRSPGSPIGGTPAGAAS